MRYLIGTSATIALMTIASQFFHLSVNFVNIAS